MLLHKFLQRNYTLNQSGYQLKLPLELETHATLARFRSIHFASCSKRILAEVSNLLFDLGEVSGETIFIDGTKIEANANKYTFVWKKTVTKSQAKLLIKCS